MDVVFKVAILMCCIGVYGLCEGHGHSNPVVVTENGIIKGKCEIIQGRNVASFLGVPFAKPPIGQRRYQKPEPVEPWPGVLHATTLSSPCMQNSTDTGPWYSRAPPSEDCLYLNVWVPVNHSCHSVTLPSNNLPVMFWIYGGGFAVGSNDIDLYNGAMVASYGNVIVVGINYRLGIFGFLDAGVPEAPGNVGLHDQNIALKWVRDNIAHFGGDCHNVNIFGESSGAASVGYNILSPISTGLFKRGIMQSAGIHHPFLALNQTVIRNQISSFAATVSCANETVNLTTNTQYVLQCLKSKDATELQIAENAARETFIYYPFPTYGNEFMPENPSEILESGEFQKVPLLIGNNKDEGSMFPLAYIPEVFSIDSVANFSLADARTFIQRLFAATGYPAENIYNFYFRDIQEEDHDAKVKAVYNSFGDCILTCPAVYVAEKMGENVYYYVFSQRPSNTPFGEWAGVAHFDEVQFVFGYPIRNSQSYSSEDKIFSKDIIKKWTNFAKTGSPLCSSSDEEWPKYSMPNAIYRYLNSTNRNLGTGPRTEACNFWRPYIKGTSADSA